MPERTPDILLVEDNPDDAEISLRALRSRRLANSLLWLEDGAQALDFFFGRGQFLGRDARDQPRVVLLDMKLPKVDGLEVLQALRLDARTRHVPVVMLTSSTEDGDTARAYELGANSFVSKPVEFEKFFSVIGDLGMYWLFINRA